MTHTILTTKLGYIVATSLAGIVTDAALFQSYGEALAALVARQGA